MIDSVSLSLSVSLRVSLSIAGRYAARFAERGVNSLPELQAMPKEVVRSLGMKVLEERRFLRSRAAIAA